MQGLWKSGENRWGGAKNACGNEKGCGIMECMKRRIHLNGTVNYALNMGDRGSARGVVRGGVVAVVALAAGILMVGGQAGATSNITYQTTVNPEFVINDSISVALSSADLVISDLTPGQSADSNIITVTVTSNSPRGYSLGSTVGDSETYDTDTLVHTNGSVADTFTNMTAAGSLTAGKWGYSYSSDSGTTWSTYNGLPLYDDTAAELISTTEEGSSSVQFKIGAYATTQQIAGEYRNIVNFIATAEATPTTLYMQDVATWGSSLATGDEVVAVDNRDNKQYYVTKLADGNIWMTQNLDHDIVTTSGFYTYANTDIGHGSTPNTSATWTASAATYATGDTTWNNSYVNPESYDPGNVCWDGTMNDDWDGTLDNETVSCSAPNHYHIGNYYNWTAAVAMNDSSSYTTNLTDVDQSICPAGWRLPVYSGSKSYDTLVSTLNLTAGSETSAGADGNIQDPPVYFPYTGDWYGYSELVGSWSDYWSSVVGDSNVAYELYFDVSGNLIPRDDYGRDYGYSVRCVAR